MPRSEDLGVKTSAPSRVPLAFSTDLASAFAIRSAESVPAIGVDGMPALLHVHSWYSLLEGTAGLCALIRAAKTGGHTALALTDTNNLYGAVPFAHLADRAGIRPLFGACLQRGGQCAVALIADPAGYRNLCHAITACDPRDDTPSNLQSAISNLQSRD